MSEQVGYRSDSGSVGALQREFAASLLGEPNEVAAHLQQGRFPPEALLQVYRNNFILSLTDVLSISYAATQVMVGEVFFAAAARGFILANPPGEGSVTGYGAGFADWLEALPTTAHLPWLTELARFEWQLERASLLPFEHRQWPAEALAALAPDEWDRVRLLVASNLVLLSVSADVVGLWRMALADAETPAQLLQPGWLALQKQPDFSVIPLALDEAQYQLLQACRQGIPLAELDGELPPGALLPQLVTQGLLVSFSLGAESGPGAQ
ncbi:HvfC/BufC family peptide modification chaperone [Aeromonas molluscorum]|uniref:HvfC/BufC family peptide modification chaperone n=1 Tax=Aeromonas molluscorum TaxID=271417 RepID=UPI003F1B3DB0